MPKATILIVEDDCSQLALLEHSLASEGYAPVALRDGNRAWNYIRDSKPDLAILDWMLPGITGLEICRRVRANPSTALLPIIILSARVLEKDRIQGLDMGADDYVIKPYSPAELMARIRARLARARPDVVAPELIFEDIVLNQETYRAFRGQEQLRLGTTEFRLLAALLERPGRVWSREQLLRKVWGRRAYVETRTVDVHIASLRKALREGGKDNPVRTVRGVGYAIG